MSKTFNDLNQCYTLDEYDARLLLIRGMINQYFYNHTVSPYLNAGSEQVCEDISLILEGMVRE